LKFLSSLRSVILAAALYALAHAIRWA